jgi:hypothetical protein
VESVQTRCPTAARRRVYGCCGAGGCSIRDSVVTLAADILAADLPKNLAVRGCCCGPVLPSRPLRLARPAPPRCRWGRRPTDSHPCATRWPPCQSARVRVRASTGILSPTPLPPAAARGHAWVVTSASRGVMAPGLARYPTLPHHIGGSWCPRAPVSTSNVSDQVSDRSQRERSFARSRL